MMQNKTVKSLPKEELLIKRSHKINIAVKSITAVTAAIAIAMTLLMGIFLVVHAWPSFVRNGFFSFIFRAEWSAVIDTPVFGILTSIVGTLLTIAGSIVIGVPLGVFSAIFISKYTSGKTKTILNQLIALFAGIPSVVYGFFGIVVLLPMIKSLFNLESTGHGLLVSIIVLAFMIVPTIINITVDSLDSVDSSYYDASIAMGNTRNQAIFRTVIPAAKRGIIVACILGIGKALGEGIALSMICGNAIKMPKGLFAPFNTMTTLIFSELPSASPTAKNALFATGVILFLFTIVINLLVNRAGKTQKKTGKSKVISFIKTKIFNTKASVSENNFKTMDLSQKSLTAVDFSGKTNSKNLSNTLHIVSIVVFGLVIALFTGIILYILINGIPHVNAKILFSDYTPTPVDKTLISIKPQIMTTLIMIGITLLICMPLGILAALYLCEYANEENPVIKLIRFSIQVLSGAPGIIIGLMGYMLFVQSQIFGRGYNLLGGILTMCIICLPTVIKTTENAFRSVPQDYKDASTAMGASRARTLLKIVLPQSITGIFSALILTIARVVSESAALIFTSGTSKANIPHLLGSGATLAVSMYQYSMQGTAEATNLAYVIGVVIIGIVIIVNLLMLMLQQRSKKYL